jgi:lipooligosaccharide transport system ATP-binding protein
MMSHGRMVARNALAKLISEHAGQTAMEYFGAPEWLAEVEGLAREAGMATRRAGPSVSVLRAEEMPASLSDRLGDGAVRRPANLEDVFVTLTGESVE